VDAGASDAEGQLTLRQRVEAYERGLIVRALEAARGVVARPHAGWA
jgi:hypothetical protein